ncbi:substrate-binding domain-containing protein [Leptolyngbya sp. CCNP1308]|uniref:substrate-binding domain-containing protein n=1 Tax=Leptolyngbya sp. CCNP1308 TaxID=3110255 RepID=UPI002B2070EE|nr:substrate-binding domain-containing protein [Leptolyngbya sp. CCNP1308]MEA5452126.1 substrate-binding domain-containing protein [Leptolyngbya sp. CCNP1308]
MATQSPFSALSWALSLARAGALLLATAAVYPIAADRLLAQAPGTLPDPVSIPTELPAGAVLRLDGSSSMALANEDLRDRFLERFPNASVDLGVSRTDQALRALLNGELDIVAAGRPLTAAERSQGLVEVPIEREKIAVIVGPQNSFDGSLSFDQFARMFRGEIRNWSEVGGASARIRVVDRPDFSDTRIALSRYAAFEGSSFGTGSTADPVDDDDTEAVVEALGADGIGYTVASQVLGRSDVRILAMHETLPDDPRYPYSQPRAYVYNAEEPTPAALAFLGFLMNLPDQASEDAAATPIPAPTATPSPAATATPAPTVTPTPTATPDQDPAVVPPAGTTETVPAGRFPWWLLGIPLLGGLLWWLLKGKGMPAAAPRAAPVGTAPLGAGADAPSRIILTPRNCRRAYAYWEVSHRAQAEARDRGGRDLMLRLYDVSDCDTDRHPPARIEQYPVSGDQPDLHLPIPLGDRDYQVELGYVTGENHWLSLAQSDPVRVPACPPGEEVGVGIPGSAVAGGAAAVGVGFLSRDATVDVTPTIIEAPEPHEAGAVPPMDAFPVVESVVPPSSVSLPGARSCAIETVAVHSRHNAVLLDGSQMQHLQDQVAATYSLDPGSYILRLRAGSFNYGNAPNAGEPWVLLWIYGGKVSNLKTGVWVNGTWSTLNGYADTLSLEVDEPAQLCAFFIDTFPENNTSAVTLSVIGL